jgi:hypothetical protein
MNVLALLGAAGIGVTWGWMLGWLQGGDRPVRTALAVAGASVLLMGAATFYAGPAGAAVLGGGAALAALLHLGQRRQGATR